MPTLERPTVTLSYEDTGRGDPPLVFLHGWCDGSPSWAETVAEFSRDHRCIAPDMRGHNRSGLPRDHCYSAEALSNDVVALCESLGVAHPVLVGHSFGGYLAAEVARRFPGFARAIVVEDQPLDLRGFGEQMRALESVIRSPEAHMAFRTQLYDSMTSPLMPPEGRALITRMKDQAPVEVGQALWAPLFEFTPEEMAERSDLLVAALAGQPSLLVDGQEPPGYYDTVRRHAPGITIRTLGCGHWTHLEKPSEFRAALREFLATLA
jgi:pimeloyl-ACP methyl ester carboxylesterase